MAKNSPNLDARLMSAIANREPIYLILFGVEEGLRFDPERPLYALCLEGRGSRSTVGEIVFDVPSLTFTCTTRISGAAFGRKLKGAEWGHLRNVDLSIPTVDFRAGDTLTINDLRITMA